MVKLLASQGLCCRLWVKLFVDARDDSMYNIHGFEFYILGGVRMKIQIPRLIKAMFFILLWETSLLTVAVMEYDKTEFSRRLIRHISEVPEMLESLLMCLAILVAGALAYSYIKREEESR